ncbi:MAG: hypothetical protein ACNA8N_14205, partial [Trueperaceae bacterium]
MTSADAWLARFLAGDARALARGLSWLEAADPRGAALLAGARAALLAGAPAALLAGARSATRDRADGARVIGL